jgi:hypothetical protein
MNDDDEFIHPLNGRKNQRVCECVTHNEGVMNEYEYEMNEWMK